MLGLQKMYNFELPEDKLDDYVNRELGAVIKKLNEAAQPCEGVMEELEKLKGGKYGLAVVSSSALPRVVASIKKTRWTTTSLATISSVLRLAWRSRPAAGPRNLPLCLQGHRCKAWECVAVEDSRSGATAAKNAKIPLIGYVGAYLEEGKEKQESVAKMLKEECGAIAVMYHWSEFEECLKAVEAS